MVHGASCTLAPPVRSKPCPHTGRTWCAQLATKNYLVLFSQSSLDLHATEIPVVLHQPEVSKLVLLHLIVPTKQLKHRLHVVPLLGLKDFSTWKKRQLGICKSNKVKA